MVTERGNQMKKRITAAIVALTMVATMSLSALAANSPTTNNTTIIIKEIHTSSGSSSSGGSSSSTPAASVPSYVIPNNGGNAYTTVGSVRITANYANVSIPGAVSTAVAAPANATATKVLLSYVNSAATGTLVGTYKIRMYKAGVSLVNGFGIMPVSFGVGNQFDGRTATVYQILSDGTVEATQTVVANGKVSINVEEMGTFAVVIN